MVYDPKVSAFLRYIGQEQFVGSGRADGQNRCAMIDRCVAQAGHPEAQAAAVEPPGHGAEECGGGPAAAEALKSSTCADIDIRAQVLLFQETS
ncbi:hypothetical protein [Dysosmobacter welbionis]|uniref:hypothetical protein n=1 Tax=Dysosmobacter welbionis TaxID=2093857 RepID=UPI002355DB2A|nr:hypothetical protein [Dysosmobacter welbionis]